MGGLTDAPGPMLAKDWLRSRPRLLDLLDGDPTRISGHKIAPYPRILLTPMPSPGLRRPNVLSAQDIAISALGAVDTEQGGYALWKLCGVAVEELLEYPRTRQSDPAAPVCSEVESLTGAAMIPVRGDNPRFTATCRLWLHPGRATPRVESAAASDALTTAVHVGLTEAGGGHGG